MASGKTNDVGNFAICCEEMLTEIKWYLELIILSCPPVMLSCCSRWKSLLYWNCVVICCM